MQTPVQMYLHVENFKEVVPRFGGFLRPWKVTMTSDTQLYKLTLRLDI